MVTIEEGIYFPPDFTKGKMVLFFLLLVIMMISTYRRDVYQVIKHKDELIKLCKNREIMNERNCEDKSCRFKI